jgi:hypothetical protein
MEGTAMLIETKAEADAQVVGVVLGKAVTRGELSTAFDRVASKENWKFPIDTVVDCNDWELFLLQEAIPFFTGSVPKFEPAIGAELPRCRFRVRAAGYYNAVGA